MSKNKKILFLHIGLPKTGTTSIQSYLLANKKELERSSICYPTPLSSEGHHSESLILLRDIESSKTLAWHKPATEAADRFDGGVNGLKQRILEEVKDCNKIIISSEGIIEEFDTIKKVKLFFDFFCDYEIFVILYIRRIDFMINSAILQHVKVSQPISDAVIKKNIDFRVNQQKKIPELLSVWGKVFGEQNIIVRPFEKQQLFKNNVVTDFLSLINSDLSQDKIDGFKNSSISILCAYFMADILPYPSYIRNREDALLGSILINSEIINDKKNFEINILSPKERIEIINSLEDTYECISNKYLKNQRRLFISPLPDLDDEWQEFSGLNYTNTKVIYKDIINKLMKIIFEKNNYRSQK